MLAQETGAALDGPRCPLLYQIRASVLLKDAGLLRPGTASHVAETSGGASGPGGAVPQSTSVDPGGSGDDLGVHGDSIGRHVTFDDVPDAYFETLRAKGFDVLYLLGVWQTGPAGLQMSLDKLHEGGASPAQIADAASSPFAIQAFHVHTDFGGNEALARLKQRANRAGLRLMIDFVPNHVAKDHRWVRERPHYFIQGTEEDAKRHPGRYFAVQVPASVLAYASYPASAAHHAAGSGAGAQLHLPAGVAAGAAALLHRQDSSVGSTATFMSHGSAAPGDSESHASSVGASDGSAASPASLASLSSLHSSASAGGGGVHGASASATSAVTAGTVVIHRLNSAGSSASSDGASASSAASATPAAAVVQPIVSPDGGSAPAGRLTPATETAESSSGQRDRDHEREELRESHSSSESASAASAASSSSTPASASATGSGTAASGTSTATGTGSTCTLYIAHGREMHSASGWADTAQLNYRHPELRRIMASLLLRIATCGIADGVRADMAMLCLNEVIRKTWGDAPDSLPGPFPVPPLTTTSVLSLPRVPLAVGTAAAALGAGAASSLGGGAGMASRQALPAGISSGDGNSPAPDTPASASSAATTFSSLSGLNGAGALRAAPAYPSPATAAAIHLAVGGAQVMPNTTWAPAALGGVGEPGAAGVLGAAAVSPAIVHQVAAIAGSAAAALPHRTASAGLGLGVVGAAARLAAVDSASADRATDGHPTTVTSPPFPTSTPPSAPSSQSVAGSSPGPRLQLRSAPPSGDLTLDLDDCSNFLSPEVVVYRLPQHGAGQGSSSAESVGVLEALSGGSELLMFSQGAQGGAAAGASPPALLQPNVFSHDLVPAGVAATAAPPAQIDTGSPELVQPHAPTYMPPTPLQLQPEVPGQSETAGRATGRASLTSLPSADISNIGARASGILSALHRKLAREGLTGESLAAPQPASQAVLQAAPQVAPAAEMSRLQASTGEVDAARSGSIVASVGAADTVGPNAVGGRHSALAVNAETPPPPMLHAPRAASQPDQPQQQGFGAQRGSSAAGTLADASIPAARVAAAVGAAAPRHSIIKTADGQTHVLYVAGTDAKLRPAVEDEWWDIAISAVRRARPDFLLLAEVYWGLEPRLQALGFDYTYDKETYDLLFSGTAESVLGHFRSLPLGRHLRCARFVENHDEPRAVTVHRGGVAGSLAAAAITLFSPCLRFLHDGQLEGRALHHSIHLASRQSEPINPEVSRFYSGVLRLLARPEFRYPGWHIPAITPSRDGNASWRNLVAFFVTPAGLLVEASSRDDTGSIYATAFEYRPHNNSNAHAQTVKAGFKGRHFLLCVNYSPWPADGHVVFTRADAPGNALGSGGHSAGRDGSDGSGSLLTASLRSLMILLQQTEVEALETSSVVPTALAETGASNDKSAEGSVAATSHASGVAEASRSTSIGGGSERAVVGSEPCLVLVDRLSHPLIPQEGTDVAAAAKAAQAVVAAAAGADASAPAAPAGATGAAAGAGKDSALIGAAAVDQPLGMLPSSASPSVSAALTAYGKGPSPPFTESAFRYPLRLLKGEGLWVRLQPWAVRVFEVQADAAAMGGF